MNKEELNAMWDLMLKRAELLTPQDLAYLKKKGWRYKVSSSDQVLNEKTNHTNSNAYGQQCLGRQKDPKHIKKVHLTIYNLED